MTEETANVLASFDINCTFRGKINVKGKGLLPTFFVSVDDDLEFVKNNDLNMTTNHFEAQV